MNRVRLRLTAFLYGFYVCALEPLSVQGTIIEGPSNVTYLPDQTPLPIELICNITGVFLTWRVNGSTYLPGDLQNDPPPLAGHSADGDNILIMDPLNDTEYICVSNIPNTPGTLSPPAFLYIAGPPSMVGNIIIDYDTVNINIDNVSFTLNWDKPFANFDPIVNYTITISCTHASCPVISTVTTTNASVNFITDLSMITPVSVTASNTVGTSDHTTIMITVPGDVEMVNLICAPVNLISQCYVTWNVSLANHGAIPVTYAVHYFGQNITNGSISVANLMATIDLPAVDSDVNVAVSALNAFGSGPSSNIAMGEIMSSSVTDARVSLDTPNENKILHSITVICIIQRDNAADSCEVRATTNGETLTGPSSEDDGSNAGAIAGGVVGGIIGAIILVAVIIAIVYCCMKHREKSSRPVSPGDRAVFRPASGTGTGSGVKVQTLDRYGKPVPLEGDTADTGVELTGYAAKSPEFTVTTSGPSSTFQGNDYQSAPGDEKNRIPSAFMPEGSYDTLAPADEPTAPSAQVVSPAQNGQSNPNAPKLNYADLEQFTRKPASVKKSDPQPASQYAVIDPKSLQQGTYT